eukprot:145473-Amphidinium_carterae.1
MALLTRAAVGVTGISEWLEEAVAPEPLEEVEMVAMTMTTTMRVVFPSVVDILLMDGTTRMMRGCATESN